MTGLALIALVWGLGLWVLLAWVASEIAFSKGRSSNIWGLLGFLYGIFAVIAVALMPPLRD